MRTIHLEGLAFAATVSFAFEDIEMLFPDLVGRIPNYLRLSDVGSQVDLLGQTV